jgi:hypothetical protein
MVAIVVIESVVAAVAVVLIAVVTSTRVVLLAVQAKVLTVVRYRQCADRMLSVQMSYNTIDNSGTEVFRIRLHTCFKDVMPSLHH